MARILESAMDAIITVDTDQRVTLFNAAAVAMFRCTLDEALGAPLERRAGQIALARPALTFLDQVADQALDVSADIANLFTASDRTVRSFRSRHRSPRLRSADERFSLSFCATLRNENVLRDSSRCCCTNSRTG